MDELINHHCCCFFSANQGENSEGGFQKQIASLSKSLYVVLMIIVLRTQITVENKEVWPLQEILGLSCR